IYLNNKPVSSKYLYFLTSDYRTPITLDGVRYRGYFMVALKDNGRMMVVNYIGMEDYLAGVLGGEIIASWPMESIKAQTVAARTYVLYKINRMKNQGKLYDVVNNTGDQMYIGVRGESDKFRKAVEATRGQVLSRNGVPVCAYYHSNSGGHTSDSRNVFQKTNAGLKGVEDPYCAGAPNSTWQKTLTADTIRNRLHSQLNGATRIFSIKPHTRDEAGRVVYMEIEHDKGKSMVFGSDFRRLIGYGVIKSTKFDLYPKDHYYYRYTKKIAAGRHRNPGSSATITNDDLEKIIVENKKVPSAFYFSGQGWGHGVGMSQWGARGMAKSGFNYRQILEHYYPDTEISIARAK
ncbi:MAG: SpoIID/LytB domain-containing protein, partial [Vulcanimicrobiota bacterium]